MADLKLPELKPAGVVVKTKKAPWVIAGISALVTLGAVLNAAFQPPTVVPLEDHPPAICVSECGLQLVAPVKADSSWANCIQWGSMADNGLDAGSCSQLRGWEIGIGSAVRVDHAQRVATVREAKLDDLPAVLRQILGGPGAGP